MQLKFPPALTIVFILVVVVGGFQFYRGNKVPFDSDAVAAEVANHIGASTRLNADRAVSFCGVGVLVASPFSHCLGHNRTPAEVRDVVNRVVGKTNARAKGDWKATIGGYSRTYSIAIPRNSTYTVKIARDLVSLQVEFD